jgi:hypothetical protein
MRFRLTAFGLHLTGSACALTLILGGLWLGWYRWPGWYLSAVLHVVGIVVLVDLVIGPTLTLMVANPRKSRRELARDIGMIVTVQLVALVYGAATLWMGRPLYYTFSSDRLELVQASDLEKSEIALARKQNPTFAPHWYSLPRWVWAPLPQNSDEAIKIATSSIFGGTDVIEMPRYFKTWQDARPKIREQLKRLEDIRYLSKAEKASLRKRMSAEGFAPNEPNTLMMWGGSRRLVAVFDQDTKLRVLLNPDS